MESATADLNPRSSQNLRTIQPQCSLYSVHGGFVTAEAHYAGQATERLDVTWHQAQVYALAFRQHSWRGGDGVGNVFIQHGPEGGGHGHFVALGEIFEIPDMA